MKTICPICSDILLRHLYRGRVLWFCPRCHQEMPNLNIVIDHTVQEKSLKPNNFYNQRNNSTANTQLRSSLTSLQRKSDLIDSYINQDKNNQDKKRLEVVNFILTKINIILVNTFANSDKYIENKRKLSNQPRNNQLKIDILTKANFLKNSEIILLSICQAILVEDKSILNSLSLQDFNHHNSGVKFLIEQSYFIDLMKTLVVDFVSSITFNSSQSARYFISEISDYFEIAINLLIRLE